MAIQLNIRNVANAAEVVQVAIKKPGFFEEAGLLWAKLYHYQCSRQKHGFCRDAVLL